MPWTKAQIEAEIKHLDSERSKAHLTGCRYMYVENEAAAALTTRINGLQEVLNELS